jgi:hypothetical protein
MFSGVMVKKRRIYFGGMLTASLVDNGLRAEPGSTQKSKSGRGANMARECLD